MSVPVNITTAVTFTPSSFVSGSYSAITGQNNVVGQGSGNTGSYADVYLTTGRNATTTAFWSFDCSSIPSTATINSVSCIARLSISNTNTNRVSTRQIQLYSGTDTAKSTATTISSTNANTYTTSGGTWTRTQLNNCYLRLYAVRGTNSTSTSYYFRLYGATLTVNYTVNGTAYEVNVTDNSEVATVSPMYASAMTGENVTLTFSGAQSRNEIVVTDNNTNVTNSLVAQGSNFTYTISNISADHAIAVTDGNVTKYTVSATSSYAGATVSPATQQVVEGRNATVNIEVDHLYEIVVKDNGTTVTNSLVQNSTGYTYTISNIQAAHTVVVSEAVKYLVVASSKYNGISISPSSSYIYVGQSVTLTLQGTVAKAILKDNGTDVTSSIVQSGDNYLYTISNVSQEHEIVVYAEADYVKVRGTYKEIKKFFKKINGEWEEVTKQQFDTQISEQVFMYGGHFTGATVVGEVVKSQNAIEIVLNDNALEPGTYKFVYEDAGKTPLDNVDEITQFTIS